ncbi:beta-1,6-N-acetylglucosaminyltransferase [Falsiroseomonas tokyonensis]|uniref:Peptide O-xylosyltransferase n=1 Tax=Falsiroseomonas tokyonensis TaxID=430521 RepID=A0ABV7BTC4_9PROT|nr:beta-1,6-N-acetylglucosaminyltransferase [Falsiroseomonas tokyonensis]MBU8538104.1 hypothetical protein [Falsiroseomonas tokyonensis]
MEFGFAVLAHRAPQVGQRLIRRLLRLGDVYLHVDAKVGLEDFLPQDIEGLPGRLHLARRRFDIRWGSFAMVEATLALLAEMRAAKPYHRITLLSGDSYPIFPDGRMREFLASSTEAISARPVTRDARRSRTERIYVPDTVIGVLKSHFTDRYLTPADVPDLLAAIGLLQTRTEFLQRTPVHLGSQWWSLTRDALDQIEAFLQANPDFIQHFRYSAIPDESFFQTAFMKAVADPKKRTDGPLHIRWDTKPRPFVFLLPEQIVDLRASNKPFVRKVAEESAELLDLLDAET